MFRFNFESSSIISIKKYSLLFVAKLILDLQINEYWSQLIGQLSNLECKKIWMDLTPCDVNVIFTILIIIIFTNVNMDLTLYSFLMYSFLMCFYVNVDININIVRIIFTVWC